MIEPATSEKAEEIFRRLKQQRPDPTTELEYTNPYTLLVAVTLSAQATDVGVNKATRSLFKKVDTPEKMIILGEEGLKEYIKTIGLFNSKAKNIIAAAHLLVQQYAGQVPQTREDLQRLPGVGRKTANVVLNTAFGHMTIAVDTHIFRVARRLGLAQGETPLAVELELEENIPSSYKKDAHHWLILHGRYVCKARRPECERCLLEDLCPSSRVRYPDASI